MDYHVHTEGELRYFPGRPFEYKGWNTRDGKEVAVAEEINIDAY